MAEGKESREDVFSKSVKAGKRTYFFDVKSTRGNDLYLTITESKKRYSDDGKFTYEKHKLFLYKEDFEKFSEGLTTAIEKIEELRSEGIYAEAEQNNQERSESSEDSNSTEEFTQVSFEDLGH